MTRQPFVWQDVEHWIFRELMETIQIIDSQEDADDFLLAYVEVCDHAEHNLGTMAEIISHHDTEEAERIKELFDVEFQLEPLQTFNGSSMGVKVDA